MLTERLEKLGDVAQLGERGLCKPEVVGSIPIISTMLADGVERMSEFITANSAVDDI